MFWLDEYDLVVDEEATGCCMVLAIYSRHHKKWQHELLCIYLSPAIDAGTERMSDIRIDALTRRL